ncbi:hypothetical protein L249_6666, partial [Ophiocordyceps polyrhachis-furcata BCC 54312]
MDCPSNGRTWEGERVQCYSRPNIRPRGATFGEECRMIEEEGRGPLALEGYEDAGPTMGHVFVGSDARHGQGSKDGTPEASEASTTIHPFYTMHAHRDDSFAFLLLSVYSNRHGQKNRNYEAPKVVSINVPFAARDDRKARQKPNFGRLNRWNALAIHSLARIALVPTWTHLSDTGEADLTTITIFFNVTTFPYRRQNRASALLISVSPFTTVFDNHERAIRTNSHTTPPCPLHSF